MIPNPSKHELLDKDKKRYYENKVCLHVML